ncbi:serine/threonine-protein kinase [Nocardioides panzhihuensis]|uniref:non-specific serine/threonine protein kinase n=1 Tax=Nocardioides panzhihuensis TaxID=860243 RepID=A0A7Z0DRD3_9ACTN|nr:serine/threonine-protein kinase [Nocardioides panzhihuensis]NYI80250.1 serine/threonine-protein kinase [Nocardioides panzhihuensis]
MSRYVFHELIGTGGMGEVWRATDTTLNREVAIKLLKPEHAEDPIGRSRFESEAKHAAALHHPNVVAVYDVGEMPTASGLMRPFLVMELVDHKPLSELLRDGRPLAPEVVRDLLGQAGDALAAAHRAGIVHRDVKPANLLVTPARKVKVTDFGIARAQASTGITGTGQVMGTPQYLSPEQARGEKATPASDVYSLGVVAFECLAGYRPFQKETPVATAIAHLHDPVPPLPDHVPAELAAIVMRSLQKDPALRYADAAAFTTAIVGQGAAADPDADATTVVAAAPGDATATSVMDPVPSPTQNFVGMQGGPGGPGPDGPPPRYQDPYDRYDEDEDQRPWYKKPFNIVVIVMLVAVIIAIIWIVSTLAADPDTTSASDPSTTPSVTAKPTPSEEPEEEPKPVEINEDDYIGRNVDDVRRELQDMGLKVDPTVQDNDGSHEPDTVSGLDPTRNLYEGDPITIRYYGERPEVEPPPAQEEPDEEESDEEEPSGEEPTDDWGIPELPGGENGNGNGDGNGGGNG